MNKLRLIKQKTSLATSKAQNGSTRNLLVNKISDDGKKKQDTFVSGLKESFARQKKTELLSQNILS